MLENFFSSDWQPPESSFPRVLVWYFVCLVLGKLILTANEEILAYWLPHDDLWQLRAAARAYWGGVYSPDKLYHLSIFPLFIEMVKIIGLPMRFALEVFYCGTACLLAGALWRTGVPILVTMLVALVLVAHPASFQLPNRCGAEILLAPLMMGSIAATLLWWNLRDRKYSWQYAVHAAVWWALAWNVRKESIVLMPVFLVLFASVILADRKLGWPTAMRRAVVAVCLILFTCSAMEMAIKVVNWSRWGLYATTVQTAPGFKKAIKSLQRIRPNPPIDYVPVPCQLPP